MVPVVLALFANDDRKSLSLKNEKDRLRQVFDDKKKIELLVLENETFDDFMNVLTDPVLKSRIIAFHYAGHADGRNIKLFDGDASAEALARALQSLPKLQLVFLNGCDTYDQVETIHEKGVKAVIIATLQRLADPMAVNFAYNFYFAFYKLNPLNESFESAHTRVIANGSWAANSYFAFFDRGPAVNEMNGVTENLAAKKTVYILSAADPDYLGRTLTFESDYIETAPISPNYKPNRQLIRGLSNSIINGTYEHTRFRASKEFKALAESYHDFVTIGGNRNFSLLVDTVLELLPLPLGFHVELLSANANDWSNKSRSKKVELLKRQVFTYDSLIQILTFTLLSCFWNEYEKNNQLLISPGQWQVLRGFFAATHVKNQDINYPALLVTIREIFDLNELDPFITEYQDLKDIFQTEDEFYETHIHMQGIKTSVNNAEIMKRDIDWLCSETEKMLTDIFSKAGFVIRYKLTTVKDIELTKSRLKKITYYITRNILDRRTPIDDDVAEFPLYTDSRSVILAKGIDTDSFFEFLTLSPFIIDENALLGKNLANLYFYSHRAENGFVYRWTEDPTVTLTVTDRNYPECDENGDIIPENVRINRRLRNIKEEMEGFEKLINL